MEKRGKKGQKGKKFLSSHYNIDREWSRSLIFLLSRQDFRTAPLFITRAVLGYKESNGGSSWSRLRHRPCFRIVWVKLYRNLLANHDTIIILQYVIELTENPNIFLFLFYSHIANSVLIFTTELMSIKRKSLFDPKLLLQIGFWPVLAGMILYYLYRKASKESGKPETKSSKKNKKKW